MASADLLEALESEGTQVRKVILDLSSSGPPVVQQGSQAPVPLDPNDPGQLQATQPQSNLDIDGIIKLFQTAKAPGEILCYAKDCSVPVWLDWMVKLSPKKFSGSVNMDVRGVFANLGPVAKRTIT